MGSPRKTLHFYFDYISPYAYFAWRKLPALCDEFELELKIHPVVFGKLLDYWGHLGPAEIPPKRQWLKNFCMRYAAQHGFEYDPPKYHPYNPLVSLRMSLPEVCGADQQRVVSAVFEAGWSKGQDLGDPASIMQILASADIDCTGYLDKVQKSEVKNRLRDETELAINAGVFGVPTIIIDDQLFWGNDQFDHIRLYLQGNDPLDPAKAKAIGERERAIDRKRVQA